MFSLYCNITPQLRLHFHLYQQSYYRQYRELSFHHRKTLFICSSSSSSLSPPQPFHSDSNRKSITRNNTSAPIRTPKENREKHVANVSSSQRFPFSSENVADISIVSTQRWADRGEGKGTGSVWKERGGRGGNGREV